MIFGKKGCDEKEYKVKIWTIDDAQVTRIGDQLRKEEAEEIYKDFLASLDDKNIYVEIEYKGDTFAFIKSSIVCIKIEEQ